MRQADRGRIVAGVLLAAVLFAAGCNGGQDPEEPATATATATRATATATAEPTSPGATATPTATSTATTPTAEATSTAEATPAPTDTPSGGPRNGSMGIAAVDGLIRALREGDVDAFASLMRPVVVECSVRGAFGEAPGDCAGDPKRDVDPRPAEATVAIYPESTCELELDEIDARSLAERWVSSFEELYAVLRFDGPVFGDEPFFPAGADYGVLFISRVPGLGPVGRLVVVHDGAAVFFDAACGGGPEVFLSGHPRYGTPEIILRAEAS